MCAESLEEYHRVAVVDRATKLSGEAAWLQGENIDLVVSDVVPLACAAAAAAGIPSVCVSNFSWGELWTLEMIWGPIGNNGSNN
jgi:L-arabinokinase